METLLGKRRCGAMRVHRRLLDTHPQYRTRRGRLENITLSRKTVGAAPREGVTTIPVVVHVVYRSMAENISMEQVTSQIEVLNADFGKRNLDLTSVPPVWQGTVGDPRIMFKLAEVAPDGSPTNGVTRTASNTTSFRDDDAVKFATRGGADAWPSDRYLNLWVCHLEDLLGYAQFPEGPPETDGVVIDYRAFGTNGEVETPFDLGRTATHEIGHWLNLFHIWGDDGMGCAGTDQVEDTPNQAGPNTGVPSFPKLSCNNAPNGDMFINFMDYVDDRCMVMFTVGQTERMHAALDESRSTFSATTEVPPQPVEPNYFHTDFTLLAAAPEAAGDPVLGVSDNKLYVFYLGVDKHIHAIRVVEDSPT